MSDKDQKITNAPPGTKCRSCSQGIVKEVVQCQNCQGYYHPSCAKQAGPLPGGFYQRCCGRRGSSSTEEIREMFKQEILALRNDFKKDVKDEITTVITGVNELKTTVKSFTEQFNKRISTVESKMMHIEEQLSSNINATKVNESKIVEIMNKFDNIQSSENNGDILKEIDERLARRNNALFFGIDEPPNPNPTDRQTNDMNEVQSICNELANNIVISSCSRIGKYSSLSQHPRPIKVTFVDHASVEQIIKLLIKAKKTKSSQIPIMKLSVVQDLTEYQRKEQKLIRQQLQDRIAAGEKDLRIVTRSGKPIIVRGRRTMQASTPKNSKQ